MMLHNKPEVTIDNRSTQKQESFLNIINALSGLRLVKSLAFNLQQIENYPQDIWFGIPALHNPQMSESS